jgi:hypothetical protein
LSAIGGGALIASLLALVLPREAAWAVAEAAQILVPFVYLYLLSIFVYGDTTPGGKAAGFPPRLFTLPMRTTLLVAWPMLWGMLAVSLLYVGLCGLILLPCGRIRTMDWWGALLFATGQACFQAVCWTFVRTPLLRLVVAILGLPSVVMIGAFVWLKYDLTFTTTQFMLGMCAIILAAYAVAVAGVSRDRRGDRLRWAWLLRPLLAIVPRLPGRARTFTSPMAAQRWLEMRRHGWLLPAFVGFFLAMLFWGAALPLGPEDVAKFSVAIVSVPVILAFFVGFGMGKTSFWARDLQLSSFIATRPLSCTALANAKLQAAGLSAMASWALVLLLSPLWAVLSGKVEVVRALLAALFHDQPAWKLAVLAPVTLVGLVGLTWLQLVAGMFLSLTGRPWVVNAVVLLYAAVGTALVSLGIWTGIHAEFYDTLMIVLWWLAGTLGLLKVSAAVCTWKWAEGRNDQTLTRLMLWLAITACLLVPLYAVVREHPMSLHLVALFGLLALPLARLTAVPTAVAWNRHR